MELTTAILVYLYYFGRPLLILAGIVVGIVIICKKDSITKLLGIWIVASSLSNLLVGLYDILSRYGGLEFISRLTMFRNVVTIVLNLTAGILLFLYAQKRYGINIVVGIILILGSNLLSTLLTLIFSRIWTPDDFSHPAQYSYLLSLTSMIPSFIFVAIWFYIFFKNRHKEKELKHLWLNNLLSLFQGVYNVAFYLILFISANVDGKNNNNDITALTMLVFIVGTVLSFLMKIYILVKGRKESEDDKLIIVDE